MATDTMPTGPQMRVQDPDGFRGLLDEYVYPDRRGLEKALGVQSLEVAQVELGTGQGKEEILGRMDPNLNGNANALRDIITSNIQEVKKKEAYLKEAVEKQTTWEKVKSWAGRHKLLIGVLAAAAAVGGAAYFAGGWAALAKWLGLDALYEWAGEALAGAKESVANAVERGKGFLGGGAPGVVGPSVGPQPPAPMGVDEAKKFLEGFKDM